MNRTRIRSTTASLLLLGLAFPAAAEVEMGGEITVATDYMFRGVSQTMSGAALQAQFDIEHDSGWYGYAWASNVDFTDVDTPDDGAKVELNLAAGYSYSIARGVDLALEATAYFFPGTHAGYEYDYEELHAFLTVADRHMLTIGYSDNVFGDDSHGVFYAVTTGIPLTERLGIGLELGHYDLNAAYDMDYSYLELAIEGEAGPIGWTLSYITTTDSAAELFYESTIEDRLVLVLAMGF